MSDLTRMMRDLSPEDRPAVERFLRELDRAGYLHSVAEPGYAVREVGTDRWYRGGEWSAKPFVFSNRESAEQRGVYAKALSEAEIEVEIVELRHVVMESRQAKWDPSKSTRVEPLTMSDEVERRRLARAQSGDLVPIISNDWDLSPEQTETLLNRPGTIVPEGIETNYGDVTYDTEGEDIEIEFPDLHNDGSVALGQISIEVDPVVPDEGP